MSQIYAEMQLQDLPSSYEFKHLTKAVRGKAAARLIFLNELKKAEFDLEHASITSACTRTQADWQKCKDLQVAVDAIIRELRTVCIMK